jgi:hypothetical protein
MSRRRFLLLPMMTLIASCQGTPVLIDTACSWVKPIRTNAEDRKSMARDLKEQLVAHNKLYDSHCAE